MQLQKAKFSSFLRLKISRTARVAHTVEEVIVDDAKKEAGERKKERGLREKEAILLPAPVFGSSQLTESPPITGEVLLPLSVLKKMHGRTSRFL